MRDSVGTFRSSDDARAIWSPPKTFGSVDNEHSLNRKVAESQRHSNRTCSVVGAVVEKLKLPPVGEVWLSRFAFKVHMFR